jgi:cytosine/creatinine deaminase
MRELTPYYRELHGRIDALGGLFNAHLHLDRSGTLAETWRMLGRGSSAGDSCLSLAEKHALIPMVHASPCYEPTALKERVGHYLDAMVAAGTRRADTVVDTTDDRVGLEALRCLLALREHYHGVLDLRVGAYTPLGFRDDAPKRWELFVEGARSADFIGSLPERDDHSIYPAHIGFEEHCRRLLELALELEKPIHIHADQMNHAAEAASEQIVRLARKLAVTGRSGDEPWLWLVHVISPSTYDEGRFQSLLDGLVELDIGVICCPSAALSMRQLRPIASPTANSIARVLEMVAAGVHVRLGSDNICDITSPAGTPDLMHELFVLCNALRYYDIELLAKLGAGVRPDDGDRSRLRAHLEADRHEVARVLASTSAW